MKFLLRLSKFSNLVVEGCLFLIIGLTPLYYHCLTYRCFEINVSSLLRFLVQVLLTFWLINLIIVYRKSIGHSLGKTSIKFLFILLILAFFFVLLLATLFSDAPQFSFWGDYIRRMGLIDWFYLIIFFIIFVFHIKSLLQIKKILITILITSSIIGVYGILQYFGIDFIQWEEPPLLSRIISTLGQPNFFGSWLLLIIPVAIFCFFYFKNFYGRFFIFLLILLLFFNLFFTLSRGAWIGLIGEIIFFIFIFAWLKEKKQFLLIFSLVLVVLSIGYLYLNLQQAPQKNFSSPILQRIQSLIYLKKSITGYTRLAIWQRALDLIKARPLLGYGPEMLDFQTAKYYQPLDAVYERLNVYPDRAHNDILDMLLIAGLLGLMIYLFLIGSIFYQGLKTIKKQFLGAQLFSNIPPGLPLALLTALFGYLISLQFSFHVTKTLIYFFLYLGLVVILSEKLVEKENKINFAPKIYESHLSKIIIIFLIILVSIFLIWQLSIKPVLADLYFKKAVLAVKANNSKQAINYYEKVLTIIPQEQFYRQAFATDLLALSGPELSQMPQEKIKILNIVIEIIDDIPLKQRFFESHLYQAVAYAEKAYLTQQKTDFEIAEQAFQKVASISPKMARIYKDWCQLKIYEEKWDEAEAICQKALSLYPDLDHPYLNLEKRQKIITEMIQVYRKLGEIYFRQKKYTQALDIYWSILHLDPFQYHLYKDIADIYYLRGDLSKAIQYNLHGMIMNPKDATWPLAIGLLYQEKGDLNQARHYGQKALEIAPENEQIKNFLNSL